jgi:dsRNA-specific ribonuclease
MNVNTSPNSYHMRLQIFLNKLLSVLFQDQAKRNLYLTDDAMKIWKEAFTHEAASPGSNYERLEFLGDAILKAVFPKYLTKRFPNRSESEYTNLNKVYMSKPKQAELSRSLQFDKYIVSLTELSEADYNLVSDVFESFFGALDQVSDLVHPGLGLNNCYNMIHFIFKNIKINVANDTLSDPITRLNQIFSRFNLGSSNDHKVKYDKLNNDNYKIKLPNDQGEFYLKFSSKCDDPFSKLSNIFSRFNNVDKYDKKVIFEEISQNPYKYNVKLTENQIDFIAKINNVRLNTKDGIIGYGIGRTQKAAKAVATQNSLDYLDKELHVNVKWAEIQKKHLDFYDKNNNPKTNVVIALERSKSEGFDNISYETPQKLAGPGYSYILLYGIKNGKLPQLVSYIKAPESRNEHDSFKTQLLFKYAKNGKINPQYIEHYVQG